MDGFLILNVKLKYMQNAHAERIRNFKYAWRNCNAATLGFANAVPEGNLQTKPFEPRFKSFSWEFACITRTRVAYSLGLQTGKLSFAAEHGLQDKAELAKRSKANILDDVIQSSANILLEIGRIDSPERENMLTWLLQHERIHHGKLLLYCSNMKLKLPGSFVKTWGKENFSNAHSIKQARI